MAVEISLSDVMATAVAQWRYAQELDDRETRLDWIEAAQCNFLIARSLPVDAIEWNDQLGAFPLALRPL